MIVEAASKPSPQTTQGHEEHHEARERSNMCRRATTGMEVCIAMACQKPAPATNCHIHHGQDVQNRIMVAANKPNPKAAREQEEHDQTEKRKQKTTCGNNMNDHSRFTQDTS